MSDRESPTLVVGTGTTGRRVADRLGARGLPARIATRAAEPPFDWHDQATRAPALEGAGAAGITCCPDLALPAPRRPPAPSPSSPSSWACGG
jgi:hypothetical protein